MCVLDLFFDKTVDQRSPVRDDYKRVVKVDEDGVEYNTYEKIDYRKYQQSLGLVENWSLEALMKAGIDPAFNIHTGYNTRLDGLSQAESMAQYAEGLFEDNVDSKETE